MKKGKLIILGLFACSLLTCVGGEVAYKDSKTLSWPYKFYEKDSNGLSAREYKQKNVSYHYQGGSVQPKFYTKELVVDLWGEPTTIIKEQEESIWIYNKGNKIFKGLSIYFIIHIPLLFEDGDAHYRLHFKDNKVTNVQYVATNYSGIRCGLLVQPIHWNTGKTGSFCTIN